MSNGHKELTDDFQLKMAARVHQRKYLCKAEKCPVLQPRQPSAWILFPFHLGFIQTEWQQWRYMITRVKLLTWSNIKVEAIPTIIAEIIQMNSVWSFFCRDWRMSDYTRTMSTHRCNVCQRQCCEASHGSSSWNQFTQMALSSNHMIKGTAPWWNPSHTPVIFLRHPKNGRSWTATGTSSGPQCQAFRIQVEGFIPIDIRTFDANLWRFLAENSFSVES